jgi:tetratricopeptide (TPR) repeat protein
MCRSAKSLALLAIAFSPCAFSQGGLLGEKSADGTIRFQAVEDLQIEGSHRVRLMPVGTQHVTPDEAKKFQREDLAQAGTIRSGAAHRVVRIDEAGRTTDVILPDSFAPKIPLDAANAQGRLNIQAFQSRKSKAGQVVEPDRFLVFVAGAEPDRLALAFVNRSSAFLNLDEQLAAMEGFVASFPDSPVKAEFRSQLMERITGALLAFENRGPYSDLLLTRRFADLARRAFDGDSAIGQLSAQVLDRIRTVDSTVLKLRSLAAAGQWDVLLDAYLPFEHYQWSFPDMMSLHQTAFEESARLHAHRGSLLAERQEHSDAIEEFSLALRRDPDNFETAKLLETTRVASSLGDARSDAAGHDIPFDLEQKRAAFKLQLQKLQLDGDYSSLRTAADQALALDPDNEDFLYYGGAVAAVFRDQAAAKERLDRYLVKSNSLRGDPQARDRAYHMRALLDAPEPRQFTGTPNWLSGRPLPDGVYYCPLSAAFQLPIESIAGYKVKMSFQWDRNRLTSITTAFDDDKGAQNYRSLGGSGDSQGNFFFGYFGTDPQVRVASTGKLEGSVAVPELRVAHQAPNPPRLVDEHGLPRIVLHDSPQFNLAVLSVLEGPLSTGIAGNAFFNPFIWDALHYFTLTYDSQGRLATAREWNADNLVRFTWSSDRLTEVRAFRKDSSTPYYQRTLSYSGAMIVSESYTQGNRTGQIKYVYSGKVLQQVKVEDGGVHDGKTWTVRLR